jgi:MOSC domain-containing protein YiiM
MRVISVNIGSRQTIEGAKSLGVTGIYKKPANQPVQIFTLGLQGDFIADTKNHGGPDQAVYLYGQPDYAWWSGQLGRELEPGTFGENLTLSDFESARGNIGDRLQIGALVLEFTAPRIPCSTLARRMADPQFIKSYRAAERPGMYCRVIETGTVQAGDEARLIPFGGRTVSGLEVFRAHFLHGPDEETVRRVLEAPIAERARADFERYLRQLQSQAA